MEQTFKIEWSEKKTTSTGKEKIDATLKDVTGVVHERVTIWGDYPDFATLMTGHDVVGTLTPAKDPKYGPTLYAPRTPKTGYSGPMRSPSAITTAMKNKEAAIGKFQDSKEQSIKVASTFSQSVALAIVEYQTNRQMSTSGPSLEMLQKKWREYCWLNYDCADTDFPPQI